MKRRLITIIIAAVCVLGCFAVGIFADDSLPEFSGTFFSLVPPVVAIALTAGALVIMKKLEAKKVQA